MLSGPDLADSPDLVAEFTIVYGWARCSKRKYAFLQFPSKLPRIKLFRRSCAFHTLQECTDHTRTWNREPRNEDVEPRTWNPEPRTWNRNQEPGTWNPEPRDKLFATLQAL